MTKQEFIDQVADEAGLTRRDAQKAVDAMLDTITSTLRGRGEINFTGFGKFSTSDRAARQGVNPRTRERITIKGGKVPRFTAGSALKQAVKGG